MTWVVSVAVVVAVLVAMAWAYNSLVRGRVRLLEAWSQIDVQLKRRHDLIPNLVETVQGYATHEQSTLMAVTLARTAAIAAQATSDPAKVGLAEAHLSASVNSLLAVVERYPQLQATTGFLQLQEELTATEDKIAYARHFYNTSVRDYNITVQTVPRSVLAHVFGFKPAGYFEIEADDRAAVQVPSSQLQAGTVAAHQLPSTSSLDGDGRPQVASTPLLAPVLADQQREPPGPGSAQVVPTTTVQPT